MKGFVRSNRASCSNATLIVLFVFSLFLFNGCNKAPKGIQRQKIEGDLLVSVDRAGDTVYLNVCTEYTFGCVEEEIEYSGDLHKKTPTIRFHGLITKQGVCLRVASPVCSEIELGVYGSGSHPLCFTFRGKTTEASVRIDSTVHLSIQHPKNIRLLNE